MEFLTYLSFFLLGYWVAGKVFAIHMKILMKRIAKEHNIDLTEEETPKVSKVPVLITELVGTDVLVYDTKNNFMCQGKTLDEAAENLLKYKNIKTAAILHNNSKFVCVEGKVKEI